MNKNFTGFGVLLLLAIFIFTGCASDEEKKLSHFKKGQAYAAKGEYKAALLEYQNAVKIDPKYIAATLELAKTQLALGDSGGAYTSYLKIFGAGPR